MSFPRTAFICFDEFLNGHTIIATMQVEHVLSDGTGNTASVLFLGDHPKGEPLAMVRTVAKWDPRKRIVVVVQWPNWIHPSTRNALLSDLGEWFAPSAPPSTLVSL
jgi:hypothetical protein